MNGEGIFIQVNIFLSYYPLKQGLKLRSRKSSRNTNHIFILLSIKTRIETSPLPGLQSHHPGIFILLSIKTRIETSFSILDAVNIIFIFILLSIKTRIETANFREESCNLFRFLSYYPLKQGLKLPTSVLSAKSVLYFYPTIH